MEGTRDYNEKWLFNRIAEGDEDAFKRIYQHFLTLVGGALLSILKSEDALEEVLQEAFLRVWLNRDKILEIENPGGWVRKIMMNECFRYMEKNGLRAKHEAAYEKQATQKINYENNAAEKLDLAETRKIIWQSVQTLSPRQLMIYRMSREQHKKNAEIAMELGLSADYVKKTLAVALQRIRQGLVASGKLLKTIFFLIFF